ncbi:SAM-dependent methyltransferase [Streptomyces silvisoli]|uniref:SAM-dependent methyltransferase n=1 Tax=Streptomyces silvisoli TaxID=3034235 RepID=A0ABT5ZRE0_9ACTN|nr:SAM-dependent methyltransferase [Streptomyces silvisoli]MDF3292382.1 SAM-dependent methyltransferase [Streptomyces silvisoli]
MSDAIDTKTPSVARMYDWLLGGVDNYPSDREACQELLEIAPSSKALALNNRAFLRRVVRVLAQQYKIRQFLDHGSGLPTQDNVHQVAQQVDPQARVVYIDNDPIVLAHGRSRLDQNDRVAILKADMRDTKKIFQHPAVVDLIHKDEPTAALFVSVAHCLKDEEVVPMLSAVKDRLAPGSLFVICQLVSDRADVRDRVTALMDRATHGTWGRVRETREVRAYFDALGLKIIDPGLCDVTDWRPDTDLVPRQKEDDWVEWGGVGELLSP